MLYSFRTGYILWHSRLMIYIRGGAVNIYPKTGMSHYIYINIKIIEIASQSRFLHDTSHTWNITWRICWRHRRKKVRNTERFKFVMVQLWNILAELTVVIFFFVHVAVLSIKTAFDLVKIYFLFRIIHEI
jgi:hypothetical protein